MIDISIRELFQIYLGYSSSGKINGVAVDKPMRQAELMNGPKSAVDARNIMAPHCSIDSPTSAHCKRQIADIQVAIN
jgi:hypothetical protein